jgi:anti-anti-sigma factor
VDTHACKHSPDNPSDGQALNHRSPMLRDTARHMDDRGPSLRRCFDPPPGRHTAGASAARLISAQDDGYLLVEVVGAIDILSCRQLAEVLARAVDSGPPAVIVDLSAVTLLSAAGLRCLGQARTRLAGRGASLHLVCPPESPPERILRLFDPFRSQPRYVNVPAAVRSFICP